uniref:flagellar basal body rod protein FlgB n=2 Tax=Jeotgalibaca TaxID=1470540 RepID=UPI00359FADF2
ETLLSKSVHGVTINKTQDKHLGSSSIADIKPIVSKRTGTSVKENGNNVDLDMEMVNLAENSLYYQALISQLNGQYSRLKTIIGG